MSKKPRKKDPTCSPTYIVLSSIEGGVTTVPALVKLLKKHKTTIYETINSCQEQGLVLRIGKSPAVYELTGSGKIFVMRVERNVGSILKVGKTSLVVNKKNIRLHRTTIKFKLLDDSGDVVRWTSVQQMKGWVKKFLKFRGEIINGEACDFTVEKTTKHLILYYSKDVPRSKDAQRLLFDFTLRLVIYCEHWFRSRGVVFDDTSGVTIHQHLASEEATNSMVDTSTEVQIGLGRGASSFFGTEMWAKAWVDWSKKRDRSVMDIESNDLVYLEKKVLVPELVVDIRRDQRFIGSVFAEMSLNLAEYNTNIKLHTAVQRKQLQNLEKMNKLLQRLGK